MKIPLTIALLVCFSQTACGQPNSTHDPLKSAFVDRISQVYGVSIDSSTTSLDDLVDLERRLKLTKQLKDAYRIDLDYRKYSERQLNDVALRVREVARINRNHGLQLDWHQYSFEQLADADSRIQLADRIKREYGELLRWQDYSFSELSDAQTKISAGQWSGPKKQADENDHLAAILREAEILNLIRQQWAEPIEVNGFSLGAISSLYGSGAGSARSSYHGGLPSISSGYYDRYFDPTYRPSVGFHWVSPYSRNGSLVRGHFQTNADDSFWNNWSSKGNVNPFTAHIGNKLPSSSHHSGGRGR